MTTWQRRGAFDAPPFGILAPGADERQRATLALLAVGVGIVVVHALIGLNRPINWDEAIHFTQVNPWRPAVFMEPHRTRGVALLVAPIAIFDPPMLVLRIYLVLLAAAGTFAAFRAWVPVIGAAAPIAAGLYSVHWVTVFYTAEILPNLPSALLAVGAAGIAARSLAEVGPPPNRWLFAALFLLFALVRPPDAVTVGIGLAMLLSVVLRRDAWSLLLPAGLAGVAAIGSWWLEGAVRFGFGPITTMRSAGEYSVGDERINQLPLYLANLESRLRCVGGCLEDYVESGGGWQLPPVRTTAFLVVAAVLGLVGLLTAGRRRIAIGASLAAAAPLVLFYGFSGGAANQRYMMPAYALLLVVPAVGARWVWGQLGRLSVLGLAVRGTAVILVALLAWWQVGITANRFATPSTRDRAAALGQQLDDIAGDGPCAVATRVNYPQIQYWSGCWATAGTSGRDGSLQPPLGELGSYVDLAERAEAGDTIYAIARPDPPDESPLHTWEVVSPDAEPLEGYLIYRHVPGSAPIPRPCPDDDADHARTLGRALSEEC